MSEERPSPLIPLVLVAVPVVMLVLYGIARDAPPSTDCGEEETAQALIDSYRSGFWWCFAAGEAAAVGTLLAALRRGRWGRAMEMSIAIAATGAAAGATFAILVAEEADGVGGGILIGVLLALPAWAALRAVAGRPPTLRGALLPVGLLVPVAVVLYTALLFSAYAVDLALPLLAIATPLAAGAPLIRPTWPAAAAAATFVGVIVVPGATAMVAERGHGPLFC